MEHHEQMLFHEAYGSYYQTVAKILTEAVQGTLKPGDIAKIVERYAFAESRSNLTESLRNGDWPFLDGNLETELMYKPEMPLTTLQKRWLKAMGNDPRIRLFLDPEDLAGLENVEPLFRPEDIVYYDRYADGDPYEDAAYIANFRMILKALREDRWLEVVQRNSWGTEITRKLKPLYLEYSPRDDKFRLHSARTREDAWPGTFQTNLERIRRCTVVDCTEPYVLLPEEQRQAELVLMDRRGALDRFLRMFCWLKKKTVPMEPEGDVMCYQVTLSYERSDESELLIRLLSMGADVRILSPESLRQETLRRVRNQAALLHK